MGHRTPLNYSNFEGLAIMVRLFTVGARVLIADLPVIYAYF